MRNTPFSETELTDAAVALLRERLPASWSIVDRREMDRSGRRADVELEIRAGRAMAATLLGEVKLAPTPKQIPDAIRQLRSFGPADGYLLIAPYLGRQTRERLRDESISYVDATGNVRIALDRPALLIDLQEPTRTPGPRSERSDPSRAPPPPPSCARSATSGRPTGSAGWHSVPA